MTQKVITEQVKEYYGVCADSGVVQQIQEQETNLCIIHAMKMEFNR